MTTTVNKPRAQTVRANQKHVYEISKLVHNAKAAGQPIDPEAIGKAVGLPANRVEAKLREMGELGKTNRETLSDERKSYVQSTINDMLTGITSPSQKVLAARHARGYLRTLLPTRQDTAGSSSQNGS
jgi:hypothetical protein